MHRYINFKFTESEGLRQKTGKSAKFGHKTGIFTHCLPNLAYFYINFVYFYMFTDILTKSYWARCSGGLGKKLVHLKNIYLWLYENNLQVLPLSKCLIRIQGEAKILKPILSPRYGRNQVHLLHGLVSSLIKANTCVQNIYICWFTFQSSSKCTIITPDVLEHQPLHFPCKLLRLDTFSYFLQDMTLKKVKLQWEFIANSSPISITAKPVVQQGQRMVWAAI